MKVKNLPQSGYHKKRKYTVVREVDGEYWFYGSYDDVMLAGKAVIELPNGYVVESKDIEAA